MSAKFNEDGYSSSPVLFEDNAPLMDDHPEQRDQSIENSVVFGTSAEEAVKEIRFRIEQKTQLTASAGIQMHMNNCNALYLHKVFYSSLGGLIKKLALPQYSYSANKFALFASLQRP